MNRRELLAIGLTTLLPISQSDTITNNIVYGISIPIKYLRDRRYDIFEKSFLEIREYAIKNRLITKKFKTSFNSAVLAFWHKVATWPTNYVYIKTTTKNIVMSINIKTGQFSIDY